MTNGVWRLKGAEFWEGIGGYGSIIGLNGAATSLGSSRWVHLFFLFSLPSTHYEEAVRPTW